MSPVSAPSPRVELARAKVNLALHITGRREDGYHLLDSLVAFPQIGDRVALEPATELDLRLEGPFARNLAGPAGDNLVLKAVRRFAEAAGIDLPSLRLTLTKRLPVASGIGGGSSDAATTLRLLEDFTGIYLSEEAMHALALSLGADVPVCLYPEAQRMQGIGDELTPAPALPSCGIVLVNPKVAVSTPAVFEALATRDNAPLPLLPDTFASLAELAAYLASCRNDLQAPAMELCPEIGEVLAALEADNRIELARMSGSGASCFGLCDRNAAIEIERGLRAARPDWWIASGPLS